jgi:hypothetical protein
VPELALLSFLAPQPKTRDEASRVSYAKRCTFVLHRAVDVIWPHWRLEVREVHQEQTRRRRVASQKLDV